MTSLQYRMLSSMQGFAGDWREHQQMDRRGNGDGESELIAAYHQVQTTIVQGDLYRLISPRKGSEFSVTEYSKS